MLFDGTERGYLNLTIEERDVMLLRRFARPLLATAFVADGVDALIHPEPRAQAASALVQQGKQALPDNIAAKLPAEPGTFVRINALTQVSAGVLLALGKYPRLASLTLAATVIPATVTEQDFWAEKDPERKAAKRTAFFKDVSLLGGLMIASADTEGRPSLGWRGRRAASNATAAVSAALPFTATDSATSEALRRHALDAAVRARELGDVAAVRLAVAQERGSEIAETVKEHGPEWAELARERGAKWAEKTAELAELARERGPEIAAMARERGAHLAEIAQHRGAELAELAKERGPEIAATARERGAEAQKRRARLAEKAQHRSAELAELAKERGPEIAATARERGAHLAEIAQHRGAELAELAKERGPEIAATARERGAEAQKRRARLAKKARRAKKAQPQVDKALRRLDKAQERMALAQERIAQARARVAARRG
ncbi:DoxX family membrane protein [Nocardia sp. NPDC051990]|uniref:DoxX family membrane protein n=1 Tax=Nocardia sp. NPDC051990 TaxID=3155285 RepID=UPI00343E85EB